MVNNEFIPKNILINLDRSACLARMETCGEEGKVNISETTYALVKDNFDCAYRGKIHAKNKGEVDMYFAEAKGV